MAPALLALFFMKIDFDLHLRFFIRVVKFYFYYFVDKHAVYMGRKNLSFNLSFKVRDEVQNVL